MAPAVSRFKPSFWLLLVLFLLVWAVSAACAVALGAIAVPPHELARVLLGGANPTDPALAGIATIVWQVRMPRVLLGGLCGLGLAVSGVAWQGVLRNPLADPYLIGASAGGALGAAAAILFGIGGNQPYAVPLLAFVGSLAAVAIVYRLAHQPGRGLAVDRLVLAGVAVSAFLSACLSLAMLARSESFTRLYFWLIGGFSGLGWSQLALLAPYVGLSLLGIAYFTPRLNLLQMGEETAHGLGVHVERDRRWVIALASLLTAAVVSVCGMVG
ncbi:MAG TPA: iron ABC transporter permease, partial [Oscillatoriaceae cyanobacterium]